MGNLGGRKTLRAGYRLIRWIEYDCMKAPFKCNGSSVQTERLLRTNRTTASDK